MLPFAIYRTYLSFNQRHNTNVGTARVMSLHPLLCPYYFLKFDFFSKGKCTCPDIPLGPYSPPHSDPDDFGL